MQCQGVEYAAPLAGAWLKRRPQHDLFRFTFWLGSRPTPPPSEPHFATTDLTRSAGAQAPLRIVSVDPELKFAGGEVQVLGLARELAARGHEVTLACDPRGVLWRRASAEAIACYPLAIRNAVDLRAGLRLRACLERRACDVVHFHTARAHALAPFARGLGRISVVTRRMDYVPNRWFAPWLYNRAVDRVIAISPAVARALVAGGVNPERITIISSAVDCEHFFPPSGEQREQARRAFAILPDEVAVGAVGALETRKGHRYLIEALAQARAAGAHLKCFIAGEGSQRATLAAAIADRALDGFAKLLGPLDDPRPLLAALDIFVMPSLNEGLGIALLEAMACGVAVVGSDSGGIVDVLKHENNGLVVPRADAGALARTLVRLSADARLRSRLGAAARQRVLEEFTFGRMAARTLELYRSCLGNAQ
jgi:glycosyltransferase involved in cell wall biosynthesis